MLERDTELEARIHKFLDRKLREFPDLEPSVARGVLPNDLL